MELTDAFASFRVEIATAAPIDEVLIIVMMGNL